MTTHGDNNAQSVVLIGATIGQYGGLEAFCSRSIDALHERGNWNVIHVHSNTAYLKFTKLHVFVSEIYKTCKIIRQTKPSCVWIQYCNFPDLVFVIIANLMNYKTMVTPHLGLIWRSRRNRFLAGLSNFILSKAKVIAPISESQIIELNIPRYLKFRHIRTFLPHNILSYQTNEKLDGYDVEKYLRIMHSGRLSYDKGTFLFLELCKKLRDHKIAFSAVLTGPTDDQFDNAIKSYIMSENLETLINYRGMVSSDDLADELRQADLLVHLSRCDSYPLIVLEALACGTVPICIDLAGPTHMLQTYGGYAVPESDETVDKVLSWIKSHEIVDIREIGRTASAHIRSDYSKNACTNLLEDALRFTSIG